MDISQSTLVTQAETEARRFIHMVYGWMCAGLAVSGACSFYMVSDPRMIANFVRTPVLMWGLMIAELGLVFVLAGMISRMSASTAKFAFLFYAALTGVSLSPIFLVYTTGSIAGVFFMTAGLFGALCLYGYTTKTDLTSVGNFAFMALIGLIIASVVNWFLHSAALQWIMSYAGILIFTALTAYDAQKIKAMYNPAEDGTENETKEAILGALALYLDFINLFIQLLQLFGNRRD
ncbi:MAG: Bax inhibitor-1/YccA family protein [Elusimicrobia bacterium]|nr:Bax inhibitor-1/YccA family protein [Elusimicrobiota bacterium]